MAAHNKLFNYHITKKEAGIKKRSYKDINKSRGPKAHDKKYNLKNYKGQITLAKACGCRRESMLKVTPERITWKDGLPYKVHLIEKGGKERDATILKGNVDGKPLFERYIKKTDNHAFRGEYARNRYQELIKEKGSDAKDYRGYDSDVLRKLTKDLVIIVWTWWYITI